VRRRNHGATVTTIAAPLTGQRRVVSLGTCAIAAATAVVLAEAIDALLVHRSLGPALRMGWEQLVAPAFLALVFLAAVCERVWPAERRPFLARGHLQDAAYFLLYVLAVAPFMTLLSVGSAVILGSRAPWLEASWTAQWPRWVVVVVALAAMDFCNWLAHMADHRFAVLWRVHALHHSQEELTVLTSFRAHPLMHTTGFLLATVPVLLLTGAQPLAPILITVYVCLGTFPHMNVSWSYGPLGHVLVSPAYHRLHHRTERQDANLGVVLTVWDRCTGRAQFPERATAPCATGLIDRPVPVEQAEPGGRPGRLMLRQLVEPFSGR
jgi:sterol desaturase/sphingolipid hydroxylase (fatty acid hydroxylase superfamily)